MSSTKSENYLNLLKIRQAAGKRNLYIVGTVFIVSFVMLIALGLLNRMSERSLILATALIVPIGLGYFSAWVKLEITRSAMELVNNLLVD